MHKQMKIGIDMRMAGTGEGIGRYIEELVRHLMKYDTIHEYVLLFDRSSDIYKSFEITNSRFKKIGVRSRYYSFAEQTLFVWELLRLNFDLVHFASFNSPILYPKKFVTTVHDIIHHHFPGKKKSRFFYRLAYRFVMWNTVRRAKQIIAVSHATKKDLIDTYHLSEHKVTVVYEGVDEKFKNAGDPSQVLQKYQIENKPYLLFVGVWRQYKNLPQLAHAFDILKEKYQIPHVLVLAGKIDPFYPEIKKEVFAIKHSSYIRPLGYVPDEDLVLLYKGADVFVLPSLLEGFGLIVAEAQAAGAPVACSEIPVLKEITGKAAVYFDPHDAKDIAEKVYAVLADNALRERLLKKGKENVIRFDWRQAAEKTALIYQGIRCTDSAGGVVVNKKGEVLIVNQHGRTWSLPKGHIDPGEDALAAAKREIYEESGISDLEFIEKLGSYTRYRIGLNEPEDTSELKKITMFLFRTNQETLDPKDKDHPEARWVHPNEAETLLTHKKDTDFFIRIKERIVA